MGSRRRLPGTPRKAKADVPLRRQARAPAGATGAGTALAPDRSRTFGSTRPEHQPMTVERPVSERNAECSDIQLPRQPAAMRRHSSPFTPHGFRIGRPLISGVRRVSMERRLAAILAADMVGYSRLMGADEAGTLAAYHRHRRDLINPRAAQYHGRIFKLTGDGALMEFASVVDAVRFAVEVQLALRDENANRPRGEAVPLPHRHQHRRHRHRGGGHLRRWREHRRAAAGAGRSRRHLPVRHRFRSDQGQARPDFRIPRREAGQEHRRARDGLSGSARRQGEGAGDAARPGHARHADELAQAGGRRGRPAARPGGWRALVAALGAGAGAGRRSSASRIPCRTNPRSPCCPSSTSAAMRSTTISPRA